MVDGIWQGKPSTGLVRCLPRGILRCLAELGYRESRSRGAGKILSRMTGLAETLPYYGCRSAAIAAHAPFTALVRIRVELLYIRSSFLSKTATLFPCTKGVVGFMGS